MSECPQVKLNISVLNKIAQQKDIKMYPSKSKIFRLRYLEKLIGGNLLGSLGHDDHLHGPEVLS